VEEAIASPQICYHAIFDSNLSVELHWYWSIIVHNNRHIFCDYKPAGVLWHSYFSLLFFLTRPTVGIVLHHRNRRRAAKRLTQLSVCITRRRIHWHWQVACTTQSIHGCWGRLDISNTRSKL